MANFASVLYRRYLNLTTIMRLNHMNSVLQNNLKAVGIDMIIETIEMGSFVSKLFNREFDAWLAGWTISIPIDLKPFWYSDFEKSPFNISGTELEFVIMVIAVSCVKLLSAHNSTQHTSRKHKV
jgi:hypothetical protein